MTIGLGHINDQRLQCFATFFFVCHMKLNKMVLSPIFKFTLHLYGQSRFQSPYLPVCKQRKILINKACQ